MVKHTSAIGEDLDARAYLVDLGRGFEDCGVVAREEAADGGSKPTQPGADYDYLFGCCSAIGLAIYRGPKQREAH